MYKASSREEIEKNLLDNISDEYMKEPGTFTRDLIATYAIEAEKIEKKIEYYYNKLDIYNFTSSELDRFVFQRKGLRRKKATKSIGKLLVKGNGKVSQGDIFETENGIRFEAIVDNDIKGEGEIDIISTIPGTVGNIGANTITLIPVTIQGITEVTNIKATYDGYDEESDNSLIERYLIEIQKPATSGNVYHYINWAREVSGVGDARVFPLWNGNNTVQIVIINDEKNIADSELIERTQNYIDPKGDDNSTWGTGSGEAPIGAYCTVISATAKPINIDCTLILEKGVELSEIKPKVEITIKEYLKSIAFKRGQVSYALLSSWILDIDGVIEWSNFFINGGQQNIVIGEKEVAILGSVNIDA